jgi:hypothetical protein
MAKTRTRTSITESEFQKQVIDFANLHGWLVAHFRPSLNKRGKWQTAVQADGAGFPDLILVRERIVAAELKVGKNKATMEQMRWLTAFRLTETEAYIWYPEDWKAIEAVLKRRS